MDSSIRLGGTRVWWDGTEVQFIRWTDNALVFNWRSPRDTAIHIPRGAVARLIGKGVLRIDGYTPVWLRPQPVPEPARTVSDAPSAPPQPGRRGIIVRLIQRLTGAAGSGQLRPAQNRRD